MKVICVIPARYGSTRLPAKPLVRINGKVMIHWVWEQAMKAKSVSDVIVATDHKMIFDAVLRFGGFAMMTSKTCKTGSERVAEVAERIKSDIVINLQSDEPLILPVTIDKTVTALSKDKIAIVATPVCKFKDKEDVENPNQGKAVFDKDGYGLYFSRSVIPNISRADSKVELYKTLGLYAYRSDFLQKFVRMRQSKLELAEKLEQLRILENGYRIKVVLVKDDSIPVDVPSDVRRVEKRMKELKWA